MELVSPAFGLIFWQTITFLVVLFLLSRFAWKPILKGLKDRERSIEEALQQADKARKDMEELKANNEKLIDEARIERDKILKGAEKIAQQVRDEAKDKASAEAQKIVDDARATIEGEKQAALAEIRELVTNLSLDIAEKLLRKELEDPEKQKQLAADLIQDIKIN